MEAAIRLFARQGFARTTTKELAREAGISEGTIYKHFAGKQDILFAFIEREATARVRALLQPPQADGDEPFRRFFLDRFSTAAQPLPLLKVIIGEVLFDEEFARRYAEVARPRLALLEKRIAEHTRAGQFRQSTLSSPQGR
ncbi:MAG TPA: helix-turn-helix domain-containing protein [Armatimonadota bacterium]|nr:helix-turn-helix domain-containing protein [Armatimonadota bacterium]